MMLATANYLHTGANKMPCYCDIPNEYDQTEIQKRCKTKMFFDVMRLLNNDNLKKADELNLEIPHIPLDPNAALCKICKILTKEQMRSVSAYYKDIKWEYRTLFEWYKQHCKDDLEHNKNNTQ